MRCIRCTYSELAPCGAWTGQEAYPTTSGDCFDGAIYGRSIDRFCISGGAERTNVEQGLGIGIWRRGLGSGGARLETDA